jgi:hypothetical protein
MFTYLHSGYHRAPDQGPFPRLLKTLPWELTNSFDNKRSLSLQLQHFGCEEAFAKTFMTPLAAWHATQDDPSALFFVKREDTTKGTGMSVLTRNELLSCRLSNLQIIQKGVQDLELIDGCKFVVRYYILLHDKKVFLHRRAALIVHGAPYHRSSTEYKVQIQHDFDQPGSTARVIALHSRKEGGQWLNAIAQRVMDIIPALQPLIDATSADTYTLIGGDALIESTGGAKLVELNFFPALWAKSEEFNAQVSQPMLYSMICKLLLGASNTEFDELHRRPGQQAWQSPQVGAAWRGQVALPAAAILASQRHPMANTLNSLSRQMPQMVTVAAH